MRRLLQLKIRLDLRITLDQIQTSRVHLPEDLALQPEPHLIIKQRRLHQKSRN